MNDPSAPTFARRTGRTRRNVRSIVSSARLDRQALRRAEKAKARAAHAKAKAKYDGDRLKALKVLQIKRETEERALLCACDVDWCRTRCRQLYWGLDHLGEFVYPRDPNLAAPDSSHYVRVSTSLAIKWLTKHASPLGFPSATAALREFRMRKPQFAAWHFAPEMFEDASRGDAAAGGVGGVARFAMLKHPRRPENADVQPTFHASRKFDVKWVRTVERARRAGAQKTQRRNRLFGVKYSEKAKLDDRKAYGRRLREANKAKQAAQTAHLMEREKERRRRLVLRSRVRPTRRPASQIARERKLRQEEEERLKAEAMQAALQEKQRLRLLAKENAVRDEIAKEKRAKEQSEAKLAARKAAEARAVREAAEKMAAQSEAYRLKELKKIQDEEARVEAARLKEEREVQQLQQDERDRVAATMLKRELEKQADDDKILVLIQEAKQRDIDAEAALEKKRLADLEKIATLKRENEARDREKQATEERNAKAEVDRINAKRDAVRAEIEAKKKAKRKLEKKEKKRLEKLAKKRADGANGML